MHSPEPEMNPYAAPITSAPPVDSDAVALRKAHLSQEANVKSFGSLFCLGAGLLIIVGTITLVTGIGMLSGTSVEGMDASQMGAVVIGTGVFYLTIGGLQLWIGMGLRRLNKVGRIGGTVLGALGLLGVPIGTLISGFLLYSLWSKKGKMIFSDQYKDVMAATPEIKYKTSIIVWILLGIVLLLIAAGIISALLNTPR